MMAKSQLTVKLILLLTFDELLHPRSPTQNQPPHASPVALPTYDTLRLPATCTLAMLLQDNACMFLHTISKLNNILLTVLTNYFTHTDADELFDNGLKLSPE
ncbi:hypothetical protein E2C01_031701 [Portunus trituberculatus]|uniref:Secreted protein n=1 Tax=Portunus trituberculatus TaxID=210409 RepID=A0A5B7EYD5_PORTR|nr:hypothetical protein [Portunus trituberculatus]